MKTFFNILTYFLLAISLILAYKWFMNPESNYEPIITGLAILGSIISKSMSKFSTTTNILKINGNKNITTQSFNLGQKSDFRNETEVNGDENKTDLKSK